MLRHDVFLVLSPPPQIYNRSTLFSSRHTIESIVLRLLIGGFVFCTFHSKIILLFKKRPLQIRYKQTVPQNLVLKIKTPCMSSNFGADQSTCFGQIYKSSSNLLPLYFLCSLAEIYLNFSCSDLIHLFSYSGRPKSACVRYFELKPAY